MVAIVSGNSLGLNLTSLRTLGQQDFTGVAGHGRNGDRAYVNIATGNVVVQGLEATVAARGDDISALRTYNSRGRFDDDNGDNWSNGFYWHTLEFTGALNTVDSAIKRTDRDGSVGVYTFRTATSDYRTTDGDGAHDTIKLQGGQFVWKDGSSGVTQTHEGSGAFRLLSSADPRGNSLAYDYDGTTCLLKSVRSGPIEGTYYTYTAGNLESVSTKDAADRVTSRVRYSYESSVPAGPLNRLKTVTVDLAPEIDNINDGKLYRTTYTYEGSSKRISTITQTDGTQLTFKYDDAGEKVKSVQDALGHVTTFTYGALATSVQSHLGHVTRYTYDASGQLTGIASPSVPGTAAGRTFAYEGGNVVKVTDEESRVTTFEYDERGNQLLQRDHAGNVVTRTFDARNQLTKETVWTQPDPDAVGIVPAGPLTTSHVYEEDGNNLLRFVVSADGRVTQHTYDGFGDRKTSITYTQSVYAAAGSRTESALQTWADAQPKTSVQLLEYKYDTRGNLESRTAYASVNALGQGETEGRTWERFVYDQAGRLLKSISGTENVTYFAYDGLGRPTSVDASGEITTTDYRDALRETKITLANGLISTSTYDTAGRLATVAEKEGVATFGKTTYVHDADNRLRKVTDPTDVSRWILYDAAGRKTADIDGNRTMTEYGYDASGRLAYCVTYGKAVTASLDDTTANLTAAQVRPIVQDTGDNRTWYAYDAAGRLFRTARSSGPDVAVTETVYDGGSRVTQVVQYAALLASSANPVAPGAVPAPSKTDGDRVTRYFYDSDGHRIGSLDAEGYLVVSRYDAGGRLSERIAYAERRPVALREAGTLAQLEPGAIAGDDIRNVFFHDGQGRLFAEVDGEGHYTETGYDLAGRVKSIRRFRDKAIGPVTPDGLLSTIRPNVVAQDWMTTRSYDGSGRLSREVNQEGTVTAYAYDVLGNLISTTRASGTEEGRITQVRRDSQGRVIAELSPMGVAHLPNETTTAEVDSVWAEFGVGHVYDKAGRRISTIDPHGHKTFFFYDEDGSLRFQVNAMGEVQESRYDVQGRLAQQRSYVNRISTAGLTGGLDASLVKGQIPESGESVSITTFVYRRDGTLEKTIDAVGNEIRQGYNAFGELVRTEQVNAISRNLVQANERDRRGLVTKTIVDPLDAAADVDLEIKTSTAYDAFGRAVSIIDANGSTRTQAYDRLGRIVTRTDALGHPRTTTYNAFGQVLTEVDAFLNTTTFTWDVVTRTMTVTTPEHLETKTAHNRHGQVMTVTDPLSRITTQVYDAGGNLKEAISPLGTKNRQEHDAAGLLKDSWDANGNRVHFEYDDADRLIQRIVDPDGLNLKTTYTYDGMGRQVTVTDPNGVVTHVEYDLESRVLSRTLDYGGLDIKTQYTYDPADRVLAVTDPNGTTTRYEYDVAGRRKSERVKPAGLDLKKTWTYDGNDNVLSYTDPVGSVTRYVYDRENQLVLTVNGAGGVTRNAYDDEGRLVRTTRYAEPISLDGLTDVSSIADVLARLLPKSVDEVEHRVYDADGRMVATVNGVGAVVTFDLDGNGRVVARKAYATPIELATWTTGQVPTPIAAEQDACVFNTYDAAGRLTWSVDGAGAVTRRIYDANGNVIKHIAYASLLPGEAEAPAVAGTANDRVTSMAYDAANRLVFQIDALRGVTERVMDKAGRVVRSIAYANPIPGVPELGTPDTIGDIRDAIVASATEDRSTRYGYDAVGRLALVVDAMRGATETRYDGDGNAVMRIAYATPLAGALTNAAKLPELLAALEADAALDRRTRWAYDAAGRLRYSIDAANAVEERLYDAAGRVKVLTRYASAIVIDEDTSVANIGSKLVKDAALDQRETYGYDAAGLRTSVTDALDFTETYGYDAIGRKTSFVNKKSALWTCVYDKAGRLKEETSPELALSTVTATGNTLVVGTASGRVVTSYTYDALANLLTRTEAEGRPEERTTTYGYDAVGRQVSVQQAAVRLYAEDDPLVTDVLAGRWETQAAPLIAKTFYDALGNAVANIDVGGALSQKTYDLLGRVAFEVDALGYVTRYERNTFGEVETLTRHARKTAFANRVVDDAADAIKALPLENLTFDATFTAGSRALASQYDRLGRVTQTMEAEAYVYDPTAAGASQQTGDAAKTTRTNFNAFGEAVEVKALRNALTNTWSTTTRYFDSLGRESASTDALGFVTKRAYDAFGNLASVTEFARARAPGWTPESYAPPVVDVDDRTTVFTYDRLNQKTQERRIGVELSGSTSGTSTRGDVLTTFRYDAVGNQTGVKDALGNWTNTYYDVLGRVRAVALPPRLSTLADGTTQATVAPITEFRRDAHGNVVEQVQYASGAANVTASTYAVATNAFDRQTTTRYDVLGRAIQVTDGNGAAELFSHDAYGHVAKQWRAITGNEPGRRTSYTVNVYDKLGQLIEVRTPASTSRVMGGATAAWTVTPAALDPKLTANTLAAGWSSLLAGAGNVKVEVTYTTKAYSTYGESLEKVESETITTSKTASAAAGASGLDVTWSGLTERVDYIRVLQVVGGKWVLRWEGTLATARGQGVMEISQEEAGEYVAGTRYNAFGEVTARGTQWGWQEYFDYDEAGRLWRTNSGDGVDRVNLYDAQGNLTAELRSPGSGRGDFDVSVVADAQTAVAAITRRTDYEYDAIGRLVQRTDAARLEVQEGVSVQRMNVGATVKGVPQQTPIEGDAWYWQGNNVVDVTWNNLAALGSGDVKVTLNYLDPLNRPQTHESEVFTSDQATQGVRLSWPETSNVMPAGISSITRVIVWKKDVNGDWRKVADQAPGLGVNTIDLAAPGDLRTTEFLKIRAAGSTSDADWFTAGLLDFGDSRRYLGVSALGVGTFEYQFGVSPPGEPQRLVGTGTFKLTADGTLTLTTTDNSDRIWERPVATQKLDRWGNVIEKSDLRSLDWRTTYKYNANNQMVRQTLPTAAGASGAGGVTTLFYDALGRQVALRDALGNLTAQAYDAGGQLIREVHAKQDEVVTHAYNVFGQKAATTDARGNTATFAYDKVGNLLKWSKGSAAVFDVDSTQALISDGTRAIEENWTYDELGRKLAHINGNGESLRYRYDLAGNVIEVKQPLGQKAISAFDENGRKRAVVDANGYEATWKYDYFGLLREHQDIGAARYTYTYDNARQLISQSNTRGQNLTYRYDAAGQMVGMTDWKKVTSYAYDLSGNKLRETTVQAGVTYQDNHLGYDALGRLRDVADARVHMTITYDLNGNRTRIKTSVNYQGVEADVNHSSDRFFTYDAMNRQKVVNAVDAAGTLGADSRVLEYDANGNRIRDTYTGTRIAAVNGGATYAATANAQVVEKYEYDALNRLLNVERSGTVIDTRRYDAADRVVRSGSSNLPLAYLEALEDSVEAGTLPAIYKNISRYDANGRVLHQTTYNARDERVSDVSWDPSEAQWAESNFKPLGYDAVGNVKGYTVQSHAEGGGTTKYSTTFKRFDNYQADRTVGLSTEGPPGDNVHEYDANGFLVSIKDGTQSNFSRDFVNDLAGRALFVNQGGQVQRQLIVNGEVLGRYGVGPHHELPLDGAGNPNFGDIADFDFSYAAITSRYPTPAPGAYTVQVGDTLQSVAQGAYGDSSLWWRIAEANGLSSNNDVRVGQTLTIPNRVAAASNNETTFKPYDPSTITGDLTPNMPMNEAECGGTAQVIMLVVAIVVSVYTAGAATAYFAGLGAGTGATVVAGTSTWALGGAAIVGNAGVAGAMGAVVGAAAGSIVSQGVGIAIGAQEHFDWKAVGVSALSAGISAGVGAHLGVDANAVVKAVVGNVLTQGIATAVGLQNRFSWQGVAAAGVGAEVGQLAGAPLQKFGLPGSIATGLIAGVAASAARGGKVVIQQVVADAFGNALGSSLAEGASGAQAASAHVGSSRMSEESWMQLGNELGLRDEVRHLGVQVADFVNNNGDYVSERPFNPVGAMTIVDAPPIPPTLLPLGVDPRTVVSARDEAGNVFYGMTPEGGEFQRKHSSLFFGNPPAEPFRVEVTGVGLTESGPSFQEANDQKVIAGTYDRFANMGQAWGAGNLGDIWRHIAFQASPQARDMAIQRSFPAPHPDVARIQRMANSPVGTIASGIGRVFGADQRRQDALLMTGSLLEQLGGTGSQVYKQTLTAPPPMPGTYARASGAGQPARALPGITPETKRGVVQFQGVEVRAVRDLGHVDPSTLRAMQKYGFAAKDGTGSSLVMHHHRQNPAGPIIEMPAGNHSIGNAAQHPFGNTKGSGLTPQQRAEFDQWRVEYWRWRATQELQSRGLQ